MTFDDIKAQYPTIAAGIGKHGVTAWDVAQVVRAKYLQWAALSFEIEDRREGGIAAIAAATTAAEVQAAYDAVDWTGL